jgi:hypothetical protein
MSKNSQQNTKQKVQVLTQKEKQLEMEINSLKQLVKNNSKNKNKNKNINKNKNNKNNGTGSVKDQKTAFNVVEYSEIVDTITSKTNFKIKEYRLNPGYPIFPYIAKMAENYEKYRIESMEFIYTPMVTALSPNGSGTFTMVYEPNVETPIPASMTEAQNRDIKVFGIPAKPTSLKLPPKMLNGDVGWKNINYSSNYPPSSDPKLYDAGYLAAAVQGTEDDDVAIGTLSVRYKIHLKNGRIYNNTIYLPNYQCVLLNYPVQAVVGGLVPSTLVNPAVSANVAGFNTLITGNYFGLQQGNYLITGAATFQGGVLNNLSCYLSSTLDTNWWQGVSDGSYELEGNVTQFTIPISFYVQARAGTLIYFNYFSTNGGGGYTCKGTLRILAV